MRLADVKCVIGVAGRGIGTPRSVLQQMGFKLSRRPSTADPSNQRFQEVSLVSTKAAKSYC